MGMREYVRITIISIWVVSKANVTRLLGCILVFHGNPWKSMDSNGTYLLN